MADVAFDCRHTMVTAVERNKQTRLLLIFAAYFALFISKLHKELTKTV